ncbi:xaa-Pro aminopeptidase 3 isoform X1 [Hydra vulgaris]|uniref:xaa-Pro aminopeptidase 3 isoform X1 n=1 Tax=Hydra vulgaris TaxID=6087 RepID=UPI001F5E6C44|nr:xaa-Pro aminopeptidase 3 isoform X1 [Hydra vulgaris]
MASSLKNLKKVLNLYSGTWNFYSGVTRYLSGTNKVQFEIESKPNLSEKINIGQPTAFSHTHLFESIHEITPGISRKEYAWRRRQLMHVLAEDHVGRNYDKHLFILSAADLKIMTNDIPYPFHQDTDFLYLSGVNEPDAILVLDFNRVSSRLKFLLFVKPKDPKRELWDGAVIGQQAAVDYFNADESFPLNSFTSMMQEKFNNSGYCVWYKNRRTSHAGNQQIILSLLNDTNFKKKAIQELGFNLQMIRLIKSASEINLLKKSATIASKAFSKVIKSTRPGMIESNLHALLEYECRIDGAQFLSFPPVVAGGNSANTLHYINNTQLLRDGELVLMDGGCEYHGYVSDITRTWPVNGKFSEAQKELYELVLHVQETCLKECKEDVSLDHLHNTMMVSLATELKKLGFFSENVSSAQLQKQVSQYCPHHLGHYLGMDTHDTPLLHRGLPLRPGMVITMEPGLYVSENDLSVPKKYRGIGIRIEDDVLITEHGPYIMTASLPKQVGQIEQLMGSFRNNEYSISV